MERVVVTGVTGHLGRELAKQLVAAGIETHGLTRQVPAPIAGWEMSVHFHKLSEDIERLISIFDAVKPDTVLHTAGLARREHQITDINPFVNANILLGLQLLEAMRSSGCKNIVIAGSYLQHYGSDSYRAFNLYAATKQAFETIFDYYGDSFGLRGVRLTLADIYSEHDTRPKLVTHVAKSWAQGTPIALQAEEAWVDLIHVEDAATAFGKAAKLLEAGSHSDGKLHRYTVTSGCRTSASELVGMFERIGGGRFGLERGQGTSPSLDMIGRGGPVLPGWAPRVSLEDGVTRIIEQFRRLRR